MSNAEERMQILNMIASGHITAADGAKLLEALESASSQDKAASSGSSRRWFRVRVTDMRSGKPKVNVNIPLGLVRVGMRMGAKFAPEMSGVDIEEILQAAMEGAHGKLIDVEDEEDGERVEIYVE